MNEGRAGSMQEQARDDLRTMMIGRCVAILVMGVLAACSDTLSSPTTKPVRDVPYYAAHPEERAAVLAGCRDNPGGASTDANCANAYTAENQRAFDPKNTGMPENTWGKN